MLTDRPASTALRVSARPARLELAGEDEPELRRRAAFASAALHGLVLLILSVLALLETRRPDLPLLVELVDAGAAGLAGGSDGGGGTDFSTAAPAEGPALTEATAAPAPPPSAPAPAPEPVPQAAPAPTPTIAAVPDPEAVATPPLETATDPLPPPPPLPSVKPAPPAQAVARAATVPPSAAQDPTATPTDAPPAQQTARAPAADPVSAQAATLERSPHARQAAGPGTGAPGTASETGATGSAGTGRGVSGSGQAALAGSGFGAGDDYLKRLRRHIKEHMDYPTDSKKRKEEGEVVVAFVIARDGTILSKEIRESSGYPGLDQAVLAMLDRSSPVPRLPDEFPGEQARVVLPFQFELSLINRVF
jgi:protein TonB